MKDRLNNFLTDKGLSATKLAAMINANPSAISHILSGRNKPGHDLLVNIANAFPEISMDWLLTGKGSMYKQQGNNISQTEAPSLFTEKSLPQQVNESFYKEEEYRAKKTEIIPPKESIIPVSPVSSSSKKIKRVLLFFDDGSFEDYTSHF